MPVNKLIFEDAEKARDAITASQKKEIAKLYENWAAEIGERAKYYSHKSAPSYAVAERQMKELMKQMEATSHEVANEIYTGVKKNIYLVADSVVQQNVEWLKSLGFAGDTLDAAFNYVPDEIVRNIITGQIYDSGWSLSKRIWSDNEDTMKTAYQIVAGGMAQNKSIYEIAKDLESYVEPGAKKPWNLRTKDGRKIYPKQVDYNAQRLARTLVQHGYQQSFKATTEKNPFIEAYKWNANGSRVCDLCMERETMNMHGLGPGIYPKDKMPMDHPNGMCTMEPVVVDNLVDQLADWFNNPDGTYPEIDEFASNFGYDVEKGSAFSLESFKDKLGNVTSQNALQIFKSNLDGDAYGEWFSLQKQVKKDLGYAPGSGKDFWVDYSSGKIKSKEMDAFLNKNLFGTKKMSTTGFIDKYGTSTKSPNAWFNSLTQIQKAEAKLLKEESGLTWNKWYEKNIYVGDGTNLGGKKKIQVFSDIQEKYLKSYGFSVDKMPADFDDWAHKVNHEQASEILKSMGTSWSDPHPYQQLMKWYNANLTEKNFVTTTAKVAKTAAVKTSKSIPDYNSWIDMIRKQVESQMLDKERAWMDLIGNAGKTGIKQYSGNSYKKMNTYLRYLQAGTSEKDAIARSGISSNQLKSIKDAIRGLNKVKFDEDYVLRRGTDLGDLAGAFMKGDFNTNKRKLCNMSIDELNDMFAGAVGQYGALTSTSSLWDRGFMGNVEVIFYASKGTNASSIMSISNFGAAEGETLLNAQTAVRCIKIESSDGHKDSSIRVFMEIIPKKLK